MADPLASLASPSTTGLTNRGSEVLSGNSSATIQPGIYSQITVSGNGTTLASGLYIIEGGGFTVSGNASVTGSGVMIFNAGSKYPTTGGTYGAISLSGNGKYNLTPPTSGTYAGIVIFQLRDNTKALTLSGNAMGMTGTIYWRGGPALGKRYSPRCVPARLHSAPNGRRTPIARTHPGDRGSRSPRAPYNFLSYA